VRGAFFGWRESSLADMPDIDMPDIRVARGFWKIEEIDTA
jgi:hypothetical protein